MTDNFVLFSGTANPNLGEAVAAELGVRLGACAIERFPDGELSVRLNESVRRREVFLGQATAPSVNDRGRSVMAAVAGRLDRSASRGDDPPDSDRRLARRQLPGSFLLITRRASGPLR